MDICEIEEWRTIEGWNSRFEVSNQGQVRSKIITPDGEELYHILKQGSRQGYKIVTLNLKSSKIKKTCLVHRLVAEAFIPNPENKATVDHINTIRSDNRASNLRWATFTENINNELTKIHMSNCRKGDLNGMYGSTHSIEARQIMSQAASRRVGKLSPRALKVAQIDKNGVIVRIWDCMTDAAKTLGLTNVSHISDCARGTRNYCKGYQWVFVK